MTDIEKDRKGEAIPLLERREAKCGVGKECEVARRQTVLSLEIQEIRDSVTELDESIQDMLHIFDDFKTILRVIKGLAHIFRWIAVTGVAALALWSSITHWPKHGG